MSIIHLCNAFFEWELAGLIPDSLQRALLQSPVFAQLQYLPRLYANGSEGILVSENLSDDFEYAELSTWGYSQLAKKWAAERGIAYEMPDWEVVKKVNSKAYSFAKSPLPGARLLYESDRAGDGMVLKSCFGAAGQGNAFASDTRADAFCRQQWKLGLPVIAEPWMNRVIDFSTQWMIERSGEVVFLGVTFCKTTSKGVHISNTVGDRVSEEKWATAIEKQKCIAREVLKEMAQEGYFGEVGFDAMIYDEDCLQPIVEINARKTMGWVTLMWQKNKAPERQVELAYVASDAVGPLPQQMGEKKFARQVIISIQELICL